MIATDAYLPVHRSGDAHAALDVSMRRANAAEQEIGAADSIKCPLGSPLSQRLTE